MQNLSESASYLEQKLIVIGPAWVNPGKLASDPVVLAQEKGVHRC